MLYTGLLYNDHRSITNTGTSSPKWSLYTGLTVLTKNWFMNYGSSTRSWNPWRWVRLHLILTMSDININSNLNLFTKFTSNKRITEFKDILPWNISQMITKTVPINTRIAISYAMKQDILFQIWRKFNGNWGNNMIRIFQWKKIHCRTHTSIKRKK